MPVHYEERVCWYQRLRTQLIQLPQGSLHRLLSLLRLLPEVCSSLCACSQGSTLVQEARKSAKFAPASVWSML